MSRLGSLQMLRACAALMVVFGHLQHEAKTMPGAAAHDFSPIFLELSGVGVDLFFVISGFIMIVASRKLFGNWRAPVEFLSRRIARIVPLYWLMTTIFVATMLLLPGALKTALPSLGEILKSYLFIPYEQAGTGLWQPAYKLGWTLNYEMFFYVIFSFCLFLSPQAAVATVATLFSAFVLAGPFLTEAPVMLRYWSDPIILEFVFGAVIGLAYIEGRRLEAVPAMLMVAIALLLLQSGAWMGFEPLGATRPLIWGVPAAMIVAGMSLTAARADAAGDANLLQRLGDASYTLYLLHPMIIRVLRLFWDKSGLSAFANPWIFVAFGLALILPSALWMYRRIETPMTECAQDALVYGIWPEKKDILWKVSVLTSGLARFARRISLWARALFFRPDLKRGS